MSEEVATEASTEEAPSTGGESLIGGTPEQNPISTWRDSLPDDIKNDPALSSFKDVDGLAKSYLHAQKMVGSEKVAIPRDDWSDSDWNGHFDALGRPATADDYSTPDNAGEIDLKDIKASLHEAGLSSKQAGKVLNHYIEYTSKSEETVERNSQEEINASREALTQEYGRDASYKLDVARSVISKFGSPELIKAMNETGLGNNPELIKTFARIGDLIVEDDVRGGRSTLHLDGANNAMGEINSLKGDPKFITQLGGRDEVGHKEAVERWNHLHQIAFADSA